MAGSVIQKRRLVNAFLNRFHMIESNSYICLCRFLVELLASNGEIMVFKNVYGRSQLKHILKKKRVEG